MDVGKQHDDRDTRKCVGDLDSSSGPTEVTLTDCSDGLPDVTGMEIEPRPPEFMPAFLDFRDRTAMSKSFEL